LFQALRLSHIHLELQLEELVRQVPLLVLKFDVGQVANLIYLHKSVLSSQLSVLSKSAHALALHLCNLYSTSRFTNVVRSGSLCDASRMASFASVIETPSISNKIFPGRTTATQ